MNHFHQFPRSATRRGSVYLAVMGVAMIVSIVGMVTMHVARLQLKSTTNSHDLAEACSLAQSGVEFGMGNIDFVSNWRSTFINNVEKSPAIAVGNGTMTYKLVDADGDLDDDPNDTVRILGIGRVGDAVYSTSVLLEPVGGGLTALETSLHAGGATGVVDILPLTYDSTFLQSPPPGFSAGTSMQIVPGTWRREASN